MSIEVPRQADRVALPFRARLSRFDRPALDLDELLMADGEDFVHVASWTIWGRRADRFEHAHWHEFLRTEGKGSCLVAMVSSSDDLSRERDTPGLASFLRIHRLAGTPYIGSTLAALMAIDDKVPALRSVTKLIRQTPGRIRWLYRHGRKRLIRLRAKSGITLFKRQRMASGHAIAPSGTSARAVSIYTDLCHAFDERLKEK